MDVLNSNKKRMLSGIQPTGIFTIGNYIGAIDNWKKAQDEFECFYFIANLHSLTVRCDPKQLKETTLNCVALLMSCGIDPKASVLFLQSMVGAHCQLGWVLECFTQFGELSRMTQFKDKSINHTKNINAGLFSYPTLMASDILLYEADCVPIGADQKQHLELSRNIATRFNNLYGDIFKIPDPYIPKYGSRIMSLSDPSVKMSKTDPNNNAYISILDDKDTIIKKFKRAVTDSNSLISYDYGGDGIRNLLTIYSAFTHKTFKEIEQEFEGKGYGTFKVCVGEVVANSLKPVRDRFNIYSKDKAMLENICKEGAKKACLIANKTLNKVYDKLGIHY